MKNHLVAMVAAAAAASAGAQSVSNICPNNKFSWAENLGWMDWKDAGGGNGNLGVRVYPTYLEGWIWCENAGWISVGRPNTMGPYANANGLSYGVNVSPASGDLSGFGWAENLGWVNFGTAPFVPLGQGARFDASAGRFFGWAWSENAGWINLDSNVRPVRALRGDTDGDGGVLFSDLNNVLSQFSMTGPNLSADVNGDWVVNFTDLNVVLSFFGTQCP